MAQATRVFPLRRPQETPTRAEHTQLMQELARTRVQVNQAYSGFNHAHDPDLIESYVYEINALQARYNYLLRRAKELEQPL